MGIKEDYTMGYAGAPGFRAGTCRPFYFFDLTENKETELLVVPFQVMDGTLRNYMKSSPEESIKIIKQLIDKVAEVGGTFVSLWHNESLSEWGPWKGWTQVYEEMLEHAYEKMQDI
ncbi:MAG: hypothetical protein HC896_15980 [Bacteroidales bacterium]|nr:hypothetical protein [Bacteroidales bacterium]